MVGYVGSSSKFSYSKNQSQRLEFSGRAQPLVEYKKNNEDVSAAAATNMAAHECICCRNSRVFFFMVISLAI